MNDALVIARSIHFAATVLAAGTVFFAAFVSQPVLARASVRARRGLDPFRSRLRGVVWLSLALAVLSGGAWLVLLASDILGASLAEVCLHGGVWPVLANTRFGLVWTIRLALAALLAIFAVSMSAPSAGGRWRSSMRIACAAGLLGSLALIGHAGATPGPAGRFHLAADVLHLIGAGAWVGGLLPLAMCLACVKSARSGAAGDVALRTTQRFSALGLAAVGTLLATGIVSSWTLVGGVSEFIDTLYGRTLALKIGLFIAMVGIAAVNRYALMPKLTRRGAPAARIALRRNALAELALGLCVLVFVGALGTMIPASHKAFVPTQIPPGSTFVHIHTEQAMAEVTLTPGHAGPARVSIRLLRGDFSPLTAKAVALSLAGKDSAPAPCTIAATPRADGTWQVENIPVAQSGVLTVKLCIALGLPEPLILDAPIVIER